MIARSKYAVGLARMTNAQIDLSTTRMPGTIGGTWLGCVDATDARLGSSCSSLVLFSYDFGH